MQSRTLRAIKTAAPAPPNWEEVGRAVSECFPVLQSAPLGNYPAFVIDPKCETRESFKKLYIKLQPMGLVPSLRLESGMRMLRTMPAQTPRKHRHYTNIALFAVTLATVATAGFIFSDDPVLLTLSPATNVTLAAVLYTVSIILIFGLHELGHKIAAWRHGIKASYPYFIPGFPQTGGTFGALILQDSPPVNRDALFDLGISGPVIGFLVTIPVLILGIAFSAQVSPGQLVALQKQYNMTDFPVPVLFQLIQSLTVNMPQGYSLYVHPVAFAGWLGLLVTFLNTIPVAQLDGGHVFRALLNERWHQIASYLGLAILVLTGFWPFAILVALLFMRGKHPGPLDDVSALSKSRWALFALFPLIWILSFPGFLLSF